MTTSDFQIRTDEYNCTSIYPWCLPTERPTFHASIFVSMDGDITFNGNLKNVTHDEWTNFKAAMEMAFKIAKEKTTR